MASPTIYKLALIISITTVGYIFRMHILAQFWTGFYLISIEKTNDPKEKAKLYFSLQDWEKRVDIDEEYGYITATLDYTQKDYSHVKGALHEQNKALVDFLYLLDSIDSLIGVGEADLALTYLRKYSPSTAIERESIDRVTDILEYQKQLIRDQKEYIEVATNLMKEMKFGDVEDVYVYIRYFSLVLLAQLCFLINAWFQNFENRRKKSFYLQTIIFCASLIWFVFYTGMMPLERFLTTSTVVTIGQSFLLPPETAANWACPSLERARQIFLKYPYNYEDLMTHQAMHLMSQVFWRELKRCNHPMPSNKDDIGACLSAHKVAYTIAEMMEVDESTAYLEHREFWYAEIQLALEDHVFNNASTWSVISLHSNINTDALQPDFIRISMDEWLTRILQEENLDPNLVQENIETFSSAEL